MDCDTFLQEWNRNKTKLYHLLNDQFIYSFPVEYSQPEEQIRELIDNDMCEIRQMPFYQKFRTWVGLLRDDDFAYGTSPYIDSYIMDNMFSSALCTGKWTVSVTFNDGFTVTRGSKILHTLNRLNNHFKIATKEEYDAYSQKISTYFNQKKVKGTFNLSIHPLDYMTMSDNNSSWTSCMSWVENGCYRRGTLEMMNSPIVVVGYLASDRSPFYFDGYTWNNKKWRVLYIVDNNIITSIKSYPYYNENLIRAGLDKLRELAGPDYEGLQKTDDNNFEVKLNEDTSVSLAFRTDSMYNDFGCDTIHFFYPNKAALAAREKSFVTIRINYSGNSCCVWCGRPTTSDDYDLDEEDSEGLLVCDECDNSRKCDCCGDRIYGDEGTWVGNEYVCQYCLDNHYIWSELEEEYCYDGDANSVYIGTKIDGEDVVSPFKILLRDTDSALNGFKNIYHQDSTGLYYVLTEEIKEGYDLEDIIPSLPSDWQSYCYFRDIDFK